MAEKPEARKKKKSEITAVSLRLPSMVKVQLDAAAAVTRKPISDVVTDALIRHFSEMSPEDRETMEGLVRRQVESGRV